ncbi:MAG: retron system putative HNH endonuclease [Dongiaceae bacterium]
MKYSAKTIPPVRFNAWLSQANDDWQPTYGNLQNPEKGDVHIALLIEQGYVCAYCGRAVKDDRLDSHIDHFLPRAHFRERELDYSNFFASCGPPHEQAGAERRLPSTCGDAKGKWHNEAASIWPSDPNCERRFWFIASGRVRPMQAADIPAENMIKALNLNDATLVLERKRIIGGVEVDIARGLITVQNVATEIGIWRTANNGRLTGFGHVAARYLEEEPL